MSRSKVTTLAEAVASVPNGAHLGLGGFAVQRNAIAFAHELIRQGKRDLTISQCVGGLETDLLVGAGAVRKLIYGTGSLERLGPMGSVNRAREAGTLEAEACSSLAVTMRHLAGALGIPFIPIKSLLGSDILRDLEAMDPPAAQEMDCPFTGERVALLSALQPDVAVIHANAADAEGNTFVFGPNWDLKEVAHAAERIIVTTERIVGPEYTVALAEATTIPGLRVSAVVEVPYGAYPTAVFRAYDFDIDHLKQYGQITRDPAKVERYIEEYIRGTRDHWEYLQRWGGLQRLHALGAHPAQTLIPGVG